MSAPPDRAGRDDARLFDVASRPDQDKTVVRSVNQRCEDWRWETRIIEFDREVLAASARGPLPGCAELGLACEDAEIWPLVVLFDCRCDLGLDADGRAFDRSSVTIFRPGEVGEYSDDRLSFSDMGLHPSRTRWR